MDERQSKLSIEDKKLIDTFHQLTKRYLNGEELSEKELSLLYKATQYIAEKEPEINSKEIIRTKRFILRSLRNKMDSGRKATIRMWNFKKYAAVAAIILLVGFGTYFTYKIREISYPALVELTIDKQTQIMTLPDGSVVHMNVGTKLTYNKNTFNVDQRRVKLDGEAFFEVTKNPSKPFVIETGSMRTIVRGTSFNVKAYNELSENMVSVREGRVEIRDNDQLLGILGANQQLVYDSALKKYEIEESDWKEAAGWMDGNLILNCTGASELKLRLKQYFNLDLKVEGNALDGIRLHSIFASDVKIDDVMKSICELYRLKYELQANKITLYK